MAGVQEQNTLTLALVLNLGTDRVISLWDLGEWHGSDVVSMDCK